MNARVNEQKTSAQGTTIEWILRTALWPQYAVLCCFHSQQTRISHGFVPPFGCKACHTPNGGAVIIALPEVRKLPGITVSCDLRGPTGAIRVAEHVLVPRHNTLRPHKTPPLVLWDRFIKKAILPSHECSRGLVEMLLGSGNNSKHLSLDAFQLFSPAFRPRPS